MSWTWVMRGGHLSAVLSRQKNTSNPATGTSLSTAVWAGNSHFLLPAALSLAFLTTQACQVSLFTTVFYVPHHSLPLNNTYTRRGSKEGLYSPKPTAQTWAEVHIHTNLLKGLSLKALSPSCLVLIKCQKHPHPIPCCETTMARAVLLDCWRGTR